MGNRKQSNGFSMIELLVVMVLTSVIGMALATLLKDSYNSTNYTEAKLNEVDLLRQLTLNLSLKPVCEANLKTLVLTSNGTKVSSPSIADIKDSTNNKFVKVGDKIGNNSLKITALNLSVSKEQWDSFNVAKSNPALLDTLYFDAKLNVGLEKLKTTLGSKEVTKDITLKVKLNGSGAVEECYSTEDAAVAAAENTVNLAVTTATQTAIETSCQQIGGTFDRKTNTCGLTQDCSVTDPNKPLPSRCVNSVKDKITLLESKLAALEKELNSIRMAGTGSGSGSPTTTPTPTPAPTATPTPAPTATPAPSTAQIINDDFQKCYNSSGAKITRYPGLIECRGGGMSFYVAPGLVEMSGGTLGNREYTDADAKKIFDQINSWISGQL